MVRLLQRSWSRSRLVPAGALVLTAVVIAGFLYATAERRRPVEIDLATASSDLLLLEVGSCGGEPAVVELQETADEVRIEVEATTRPLGGAAECLDGLRVRLSEPLGGRLLLDGASGDVVEVQEAG